MRELYRTRASKTVPNAYEEIKRKTDLLLQYMYLPSYIMYIGK